MDGDPSRFRVTLGIVKAAVLIWEIAREERPDIVREGPEAELLFALMFVRDHTDASDGDLEVPELHEDRHTATQVVLLMRREWKRRPRAALEKHYHNAVEAARRNVWDRVARERKDGRLLSHRGVDLDVDTGELSLRT